MIISDTAVRQRISVVVLAAILVIYGYICYNKLPREAEPDITIPYVFISTSYKGVSAEDMETSITIPIEKKLKNLEGVKEMKSVSSEGLSSINIEFVTGTDIDDALQKVRNKVDEAKGELPGDLENDPSVFEVNFSEMPIVVFSLSGTCGNPCLKRLADDLKDDVEGISGVLEAEVTGGRDREIRIEVIPEKLAYYAMPITAFQRVVAGENTNTSGGALRLGDGRYQLQVPGEFRTPEEIYGLVVGTHNGQPVYLKDVARVVDGYKEEISRSRLDGRESVSIAVKKRAGENALRIAGAIDRIIERRSASWPEGTEITKLMDRAKEVRLMVADLENNILTGLVLVVVVILFSMGLRNALLVSLAIPFSMLISFSVLSALDITLNNVVLYSLTLALGMLVDNAIVIVENIYRHMQQGVPRVRAAMRATSEVAYPVIGSTLTTLAAFMPLLFWPGIMGEFMSYMPITLIVTLSSSLFVAMVINPALCAMLMKLRTGHGVDKPLTEEEVLNAGEAPVELKGLVLKLYERTLRIALKHRMAVMISAFLMLVIMVQVWLLVVGIEKPVEFFPDIDPRSMYVNIEMPEGADLDYIDKVIKQVEMRINGITAQELDDPGVSKDALYRKSLKRKEHKELDGTVYTSTSDLENIESVYAQALAIAGPGSAFDPRSPSHVAMQFLDFEKRRSPTRETVDVVRERVKHLPGGGITVSAEEGGPPTGSPINIEISGDDFRVLGEIAKNIRGMVEQVPHVKDVRDDYDEGTPTVNVRVDRQRAALFGLTTDSIGIALKTGYNGLDVSTYREYGEDYDITVQLDQEDRKVIDVLREFMVPTPTGNIVPLTSMATIDYSGSIGSINRIDGTRVVTVRANVDETKVPGPVARAEAEKLLGQLPLPPGYRVAFTGEFEFQKESEEFLSNAFMMAIFLIFLILVTQFNSISQPFIIMVSVLLSLGGAFLGLSVLKLPFGIIMTGVGVISLAGVVVNNAIVLIDYINKLRERGHDVMEAAVAGGATRLRPVLLTAITTLLGLLPMVTGISYDFHHWAISWASESSQWWRSMAIVVIFGLLVSTFLTLVIVPTLYCSIAGAAVRSATAYKRLKAIYWWPYEKLFGGKSAGQGIDS